MGDLPVIVEKETMNIWQVIRLKIFQLRNFNINRYEKSPSYIKNDEKVLKAYIDYKIRTNGEKELIHLFKNRSELFGEKEKKVVIYYAIESNEYELISYLKDNDREEFIEKALHLKKYEIISMLSQSEQERIYLAKNTDIIGFKDRMKYKRSEINQYLDIETIKKLINDKNFDLEESFEYCSSNIQQQLMEENKDYIKFASDEAILGYLKNHLEDFELIKDSIKGQYVEKYPEILEEHPEYAIYASDENQLEFATKKRDNLRFIKESLQIEIIEKYPKSIKYASISTKEKLFKDDMNNNGNLAKKLVILDTKDSKYIKEFSRTFLIERNILRNILSEVKELDIEKAKEIFLKYGVISEDKIVYQEGALSNLTKEQLTEIVKIDSNYVREINDKEKCKEVFKNIFGEEKLECFEKYIYDFSEKKSGNQLRLLFNEKIMNLNSVETIASYCDKLLQQGDTEEVREEFTKIINNTYGENAKKILEEREELKNIENINSLDIFDDRITNSFSEEFINDLLSYNIQDFSTFLNIVKNDRDLSLFKWYYSTLSQVMGENVEVMQKAISEFYYCEELLENIKNIELNEEQQKKLISCLCSRMNKFEIDTLEELNNFDEIANTEIKKEINELRNLQNTEMIKEVICRNILGIEYKRGNSKYGESIIELSALYDIDEELKSKLFDDTEKEMLEIIKSISNIEDFEDIINLSEELMKKQNIRNPIALFSTIAKFKENEIEILNSQLLTKEKLDKMCDEEKGKKLEERKIYKEIKDGVEIYHMEGADGNFLFHNMGQNLVQTRDVEQSIQFYMEKEGGNGKSTVSTRMLDISSIITWITGKQEAQFLLFSKIESEDIVTVSHDDGQTPKGTYSVKSTGKNERIKNILGYRKLLGNEVGFYRRVRNHKKREKNNIDGRIKPDFICQVKKTNGSIVGRYSPEECKKYGIPVLIINESKYKEISLPESEKKNDVER